MIYPKISVVTVSYNAIRTISKTITNVLSQKYPNLEYIVIDGGSTDGTFDILIEYSSHFTYWVSEPDRGIYYAMNKAINIATGEWIIFMNAGDLFVGNVLNKIFSEEIDNTIDVIYGDTIIKYPFGDAYVFADFFADNDINLPFCHQSAIVRTKYMKKKYFDPKYKVAADYNFFYSLYKEGRFFLYVSMPIALYDSIGFSANRVFETFIEVSEIRATNTGIKYKVRRLYFLLRRLVVAVIPDVFINNYRRRKYAISNYDKLMEGGYGKV